MSKCDSTNKWSNTKYNHQQQCAINLILHIDCSVRGMTHTITLFSIPLVQEKINRYQNSIPCGREYLRNLTENKVAHSTEE